MPETPSPTLCGWTAKLVETGEVSSVVALVEGPGGVEWGGAGRPRVTDPAAPDPATLFDLGSLTKLFTVSLALVLDAQGALPLETEVGEVFPQAHPDLAGRGLEDLLRHRAGLAAWHPLYRVCGEPAEARPLLLDGSLLGAAPGTYSDLDFILWSQAAEAVTGQPFARLLRDQLCDRLGLEGVAPSPGDLPAVAECRLDNGREVELAAERGIEVEARPGPPPGVVQDGNARFLFGLSGHAGLFASAMDLRRLAGEWLRPGEILDPGAVEAALAGDGAFALGWRRWSAGGSGAPLSRSSFGHAGFPGGSLWIDPERSGIFLLLAHKLSSRTDPTPWRHRFHRLAVDRRGEA